MPDLRPAHNPPNRFDSRHLEWDEEPPPPVELAIFEEHAKTIVSANKSPDVGFRFSVNPYRGCFHGCIYCYARPSHQYWGFGAGTDFERKLVVKVNAPELLDRELAKKRHRGERIAFSGNTDCYQPLEAHYELTKRCLEVCLARGAGVGIITKGSTIRRDLELIARLAAGPGATVFVSLAFIDDAMRRVFDPYAAPVEARLETMRRLSAAGIPVGVAVSPIVPGANDSMIPAILEAARAAGASRTFMSMLRLPGEVLPVFDVALTQLLPQRARKVMNGIAELRGGKLNDPRFGARMRGNGPRWHAIEQLFALHKRRLGYLDPDENDGFDDGGPAAPPAPDGQLSLF